MLGGVPPLSTTVVKVLDLDIQADPRLTVLTSLVEMFGSRRGRLPPRVVARARVLARGVPIQELLAPFTAASYLPDFLSPSGGSARSFDEQLEELRETPDHVVLRDLAREEDFVFSASGLLATDGGAAGVGTAVSGRHYWATWREDPRRNLGRYCSFLQQYRATVVDAVYPRFESVLFREVHRLERATAEWGPEISFGHLHPDIRFADGRLTWDRSKMVLQRGWSPDVLALKPMISSPTTRLSDLEYNSFTGNAHAAIGVATGSLKVGVGGAGRPVDHLDLLLGQARARIVRTLQVLPGTTTDLAGELGYAPSTISYHLKAFARAGVVDSHRMKGSVCYHLTGRGVALTRL